MNKNVLNQIVSVKSATSVISFNDNIDTDNTIEVQAITFKTDNPKTISMNLNVTRINKVLSDIHFKDIPRIANMDIGSFDRQIFDDYNLEVNGIHNNVTIKYNKMYDLPWMIMISIEDKDGDFKINTSMKIYLNTFEFVNLLCTLIDYTNYFVRDYEYHGVVEIA